ncbi:GAF domain-containing protein [Conexibacter sp. W3-3-2]|uniref:sensor histidine kinase n=1 Tax=Conexibacter sp. W3-3-2 TaxID=2675227 RepID=UPI0012B6C8A5|nr:GAF domain-containing sensor histidine kinase [Conexibacter sp. W3-3-2]MTD43621.1 GAF domain-containing protein [Conexibacter sp. W3-3-2]
MPTRSPDARAAALGRLLEVGRSLTAELELEPLLERILATARELTGARYAAIGVLDEDRRALARFVTAGVGAETQAAIGHLPRGQGILGLLIDRPEPLRLADVSAHPRSFGFPAGHPPMRAFLGVPILIRGEAWGNLYLTEKTGADDFDEDDVEAVVVLAEWAAVAVHNAKLYGEAAEQRASLQAAVGRLEATIDVALALGGETDLEALLELIARRARALVDADALLIWLQDGPDLRIAASDGSARVPPDAAIPLEGSTSGQVIRDGRPVRIDDVRTGLRVSPAAFGMADARSALLVPLVHRGRSFGLLAAFDRLGDTATFARDDERALQSFAASAASAVATARSVEAQRLRDTIAGAERERARWARELHDETLQGMASLKLALTAASRTEGERSREVLALAMDRLDGDIAALRAIISDLRPAALDELGLVAALRTLLDRTAADHGLAVALTESLGEARIEPEIETVAYRIAQEALSNVAKHARAAHVTLGIDRVDGRLVVTVGDDGVGGVAERPGGFGLAGMRERAALAGGAVRIRSGAAGTTVTATLPLD